MRTPILIKFDLLCGILFLYGFLHILATNFKTKAICILCECRFWLNLICQVEYYFHIKPLTFWLQLLWPNLIVLCECRFWLMLICHIGILFSYGNHYILDTNIDAQSNCIFCECPSWLIMICNREYYFHIETMTFWLQILKPNPIVFCANADFD